MKEDVIKLEFTHDGNIYFISLEGNEYVKFISFDINGREELGMDDRICQETKIR